MTEFRLLRVFAVFMVIVFVFLMFTPRLCQTAIVRGKQAPVISSATTPPSTGLRITTPGSETYSNSPIQFPPGLDRERIQYLVEIDPTFAAPQMMPAVENSPLLKVLLDHQYAERDASGKITLTREGQLNVSGASESPEGLGVPVAKRTFMAVDAIDDAGGGIYNVKIRWRWQPNAIGSALEQRFEDHTALAEFVGGERHWVLHRFVNGPSNAWP